MNMRDDDVVSAVALVMESEPEVAGEVADAVIDSAAPPVDASEVAGSNGGGPTDDDGAAPDESADDE